MFSNERELQNDLAGYLRESGYLTYTEIEIKGGKGGRADVIAVKPSYANKDIRIYEVKNNRRSFDKDNKYLKYLESCHRLYIACPKGLVQKDELHPKIGLIYRNENGWYVVKAPKKNYPDITLDFVFSLLYHGYEETLVQRRLRDRIIAEDNCSLRDQAYKIGFELGRRLDKDRETNVEEWIKNCANLFRQYLNLETSWGRFDKDLPSLYELEYILSSIEGITSEIQHIKAIGNYLRHLELPEQTDDKSRRSNCRKDYREKAMKFKNAEGSICK